MIQFAIFVPTNAHNMKKGVIYARVSTSSQSNDRQVHELMEYAKRNQIEIVKVFQDTISGSTDAKNRRGASDLFEFMKTNVVNVVLVHEVSRLGRSAIDVQKTVHEIVNVLQKDIYIASAGVRARIDGKVNPVFKMLLDMMANIAEIERNTIRERVISGMQAAKRRGKHIGRRKGTKESSVEFCQKHSGVRKRVELGKYSVREIAKLEGVSPNTVMKMRKIISTNRSKVYENEYASN